MSGSRGRKVTSGRPGDSRWPNQQPYYNQNASVQDPRSGWDNWNFPAPSTGYNMWQHNSNLHQVWPSSHYRGGRYYPTEDHNPRGGDFDHFQHRFPNSFIPPSQFSERSLAHLNQTPLNELSSSGQSGSRDVSSSSSKQPNSAKDKQNVQSVRSQVTAEKSIAAKNKGNLSSQEISSSSRNLVSVGGAEKQNVPARFMPPNDDLMNKVRASLEKIAATKDQVPVRTTSSTPAEPTVPSSPQKVRESRITEASPRVAGRSHRRISQSSTTSNSGANNETSNNPLEGIGFIQNISSCENLESVSQASRIRNSSGGSSTHESDLLTTIPKEKLNNYIRSMDNHQRRQLVEQPRSVISQFMLNHLVQENQTARARQLSSIRYRVSSTELESTSKTENTVILSEELVDEFKELLSRNDEETTKQPDSEEEEIQVLEPPPKIPPLCIDLDLDDKPTSPSSNPPLNVLNSTPVQQIGHRSISDLNDSTSDFVERELDCQLTAALRPAVAPTPNAVIVPESLLHPPLASEASVTIEVPCIVSLSLNTSSPTVTLHPSSLQKTSTASTSTAPSITTTVSAGKKSFLENESKIQKRKERTEKNSRKQNSNKTAEKATKNQKRKEKRKEQKKSDLTPEKQTKNQKKKEKRKETKKSDLKSVPSGPEKSVEIINLDKAENVASAMNRAGASNRIPDLSQGGSALNFLLTDLQSEEEQGKVRIALIDRTIEELQRERKVLTDKVLSLKQQQFDLLRSAMPLNSFVSDSTLGSSESVTALIKATLTSESRPTDEKDKNVDKAASEEPSPVQPVPPAASTQLLSLMHQLEENGVQVALGDMEVVFSDLGPPSNVSSASKRKRIPSDTTKQQKKKSASSSPSQSTGDNSAVETPDQVQTNEVVIQPIPTNSNQGPSQTMSISQINQITSTISPDIAQSLKSRFQKKTPTPIIVSNQSNETASSSELPLIAESHNQSKEIPTTLSPVMLEPKVVESKVVDPKIMEPNVTQPKKFSPFPDKVKVVDSSKMVEKPSNVSVGENVRTYSRRDESSKQKITPKPIALVNAQGSGAAGKLPTNTKQITTESSQVKEAAATATHQVSIQVTTSSSASDKQPLSTKTVSQTKSPNPVLLRPHRTGVRSVFICGSCAFTASEDGTVHIYDLKTNSLVMRILGHSKPVTWLYGISLTTSSEMLKTIQFTTEYLNHLTLITGCEDENIRQFSLESGSLTNERFCNYTLTCVVGHRGLSKLFVGTLQGAILTYNPTINSIRINKFKANGEILCLKIISIHGKKAIIVAARRMDPVVYDMETEDALFTLTSNIPSNSFYSISNTSHFVFCCDANKNFFKFDLNSDKTDNMYQTEILPHASVNSYLYGKRFLILACMDGVLRVLDITQTQRPYSVYDLPGQSSGQCLKTITCMKVVADMIVCGSIGGEVAYYRIPNLEALCKVNEIHY